MDTKLLKQKILDLAIRGKLVPQDPNDEPASVLLERIWMERKKLIAEGKLKRTKKTSDNWHYENVPFEIPESWAWTNIKEISSSILYGVSESAKPQGKYKLLRITDIQENRVDWNSVPFTDYDTQKAQNYLLQDGDILFARTGATVGKSYLVQGLSEIAIYASYLIRVQTNKEVFPQYIKLYFESGYYWEQISDSSVGTGQPNVNGSLLGELWIPIPPHAEQMRIVDEVVKWFVIIDDIEQNKAELREAIKQTRSTILNLAVHGKLVPQDPHDEPTKELLKRIAPHAVPCDTSHYENVSFKVPESWAWVKIKDVATCELGKTLDRGKNTGKPYNYLCAINVKWGTFDFTTLKQILLEDQERERYLVRKGDLLICEGGDVGRSAIWESDDEVYYQNALHRVRFNGGIDQYFFYYVLQYYKQIGLIDDVSGGVTIKHFTQNSMKKLLFPLPPINEQKRISKQIARIFSVMDAIITDL